MSREFFTGKKGSKGYGSVAPVQTKHFQTAQAYIQSCFIHLQQRSTNPLFVRSMYCLNAENDFNLESEEVRKMILELNLPTLIESLPPIQESFLNTPQGRTVFKIEIFNQLSKELGKRVLHYDGVQLTRNFREEKPKYIEAMGAAVAAVFSKYSSKPTSGTVETDQDIYNHKTPDGDQNWNINAPSSVSY